MTTPDLIDESTSTVAESGEGMTLENLMDCIGMMDSKYRLGDLDPVKMNVTPWYRDHLRAEIPQQYMTYPPAAFGAGSFAGFPIFVREDLPEGALAEFINSQGKIVGRITK